MESKSARPIDTLSPAPRLFLSTDLTETLNGICFIQKSLFFVYSPSPVLLAFDAMRAPFLSLDAFSLKMPFFASDCCIFIFLLEWQPSQRFD